MFSNREIASAIWMIGFILFAFLKPEVRKSFSNLIRVSLNWKIIIPVLLLIVYVIGIVWGLKIVGVWTQQLLKDTVLWFVFSGVALAFSFVAKIPAEGIIRKVAIDNIKIIVLIEFLVAEYTFSLPIELILIPIITIVAILDVIARMEEKYASIRKLTTAVQVFFGLVVISFAIVHAVNDYKTFETINSIRQVLLVPLLSILLVPYIYILLVCTNYELLFLRLDMKSDKESDVKWYAKWRLINYLKMRPIKIRKFIHSHAVDLIRIRTKTDIDKLISTDELKL